MPPLLIALLVTALWPPGVVAERDEVALEGSASANSTEALEESDGAESSCEPEARIKHVKRGLNQIDEVYATLSALVSHDWPRLFAVFSKNNSGERVSKLANQSLKLQLQRLESLRDAGQQLLKHLRKRTASECGRGQPQAGNGTHSVKLTRQILPENTPLGLGLQRSKRGIVRQDKTKDDAKRAQDKQKVVEQKATMTTKSKNNSLNSSTEASWAPPVPRSLPSPSAGLSSREEALQKEVAELKRQLAAAQKGIKPEVTTTTKPFDCNAGLSNSEKGWSNMKKEHCCKKESKGCPVLSKGSTVVLVDAISSQGYTIQKGSRGVVDVVKSDGAVAVKFKKQGPAVLVARADLFKLRLVEFDCKAGLDNWKNGWSAEKQEFCCEHADVGCKFNCSDGFSNWELGWSDEKKEWCYTYKHTETGPGDFQCDSPDLEDFEEAWPDKKKEQCCLKKNTPTCAHVCDMDMHENWELWSKAKKDWCCEKMLTPTCEGQYQCDYNVDRWKTEWAQAKKDFCCAYHNTDTCKYDCAAGIDTWQTGWSKDKQEWCCKWKETDTCLELNSVSDTERLLSVGRKDEVTDSDDEGYESMSDDEPSSETEKEVKHKHKAGKGRGPAYTSRLIT